MTIPFVNSSSSEEDDLEDCTSWVEKGGGCQPGGRDGTMSSSRGRSSQVDVLCICAWRGAGGHASVRVPSIIIYII